MSAKKRLFWILWAAGIAGVVSFLFVDLPALIASIPPPPGAPPVKLPPPAVLKSLSLIQPSLLVSLAVFVGVWLAGKVGLRAPAAEAWAERDSIWKAMRPQILPGILTGLASGIAIVACWVVAKPFLPPGFIARAQDFNKFLPHVTRMLYGGFTEEILLRWGVMTFVVWVLGKVRQKGEGLPKAGSVIAAIVVSAALFGMGHLPIAALLGGGLTLSLTLYVVSANSIFGLAAGFLYWRRGLEAAIVAHMAAHVVLIVVIRFGL